MRASSSAFILAACVQLVRSQGFTDEGSLPGCGQTCFNSMLAQASSFGCDSGAASCLCTVPDFNNGIRDCASNSCAIDLFPQVTNYLYSVCGTATLPAATAPPATNTVPPSSVPTATPAPVTDTQAVPPVSSSTSPAATTPQDTATPVVTTPVPSATVPPVGAANSTSTGDAQAAPTTSSLTSTGTTTTSSATNGVAIATKSSSSTTAGSSETSTADSSSASETSTGATTSVLSSGAKAGIGIGAAVGAVAVIAAVAAVLITRKHRNRNHSGHMQISDPMPGSGRIYADERDVSDLEMKSRRYEDMIPRHVPRNVI